MEDDTIIDGKDKQQLVTLTVFIKRRDPVDTIQLIIPEDCTSEQGRLKKLSYFLLTIQVFSRCINTVSLLIQPLPFEELLKFKCYLQNHLQ